MTKRYYLLALVVVGVSAVMWSRLPGPDFTDGPLEGFSGTGQTMTHGPGGGDVPPGQEITFGWQILTNPTSQDIVVTDVSLLMGDPGLEIIGGPLVWDDGRRSGGIASSFGWPPEDTPEWAEDPAPYPLPDGGLVLAPDDGSSMGTAINFGLRFDGSDRASVIGWIVTYESGDQNYREFFSSSLAVCPSQPCENEESGIGRETDPPD